MRLIIAVSAVRSRPPLPHLSGFPSWDPAEPGGPVYLRAAPEFERETTVAKSDKRPGVTMACEQCKRRNYQTTKNKVNTRDRLQLKKYCPWCSSHTDHRETR